MVLEVLAAGLAKGVTTRLAGSTVAAVVARVQDKRAFKKAMTAALRATDMQHADVLRRYSVNPGFFEHEGADEIARLLLPGRGPDARRLARGYIESLPGDGSRADSDGLVQPFEALLWHLQEELGRHPRFRTALGEVAQTRPEHVGVDVDERELLEWMCERFARLRTVGTGSISHVQLKLRDVFVAPAAVRESRAGRRWSSEAEERRALLLERVRTGAITHAEYEARLDRLGLEHNSRDGADSEAIAVADVIKSDDQVVVLGDPGTGKTTLLSYIALRHAEALLADDETIDAQFGSPRMPVYLRAGDFSRSLNRAEGLRAFIAPSLATLQCPVPCERLDALFDRALRAGRCLILVDGFDEVTSAHERATVVAAITAFAAAQQPRGNRFICTSRILGYAAAPLPTEFTVVRLLAMDDASIERFLSLYTLSIELAEVPNRNPESAREDAKRTVTALLAAFASTPGVRRLAANPLLLTTLLLVHRTRGALPERRVDAYKAVTEALGHTWRAAQGVPKAELPDDRRLTQWLTRLADWMHRERPEGSATQRDLLAQWGPLWAALHRQPWSPGMVDCADPAASEIGQAIAEFVTQIEAHSGLLVERAPQRWGFSHLTFEEFYAGRALAFDGRATERPRNIRRHLHDVRYDEPILLALGLIGREQPEEIESVLEASLLARGEDAERLKLQPSPFEDLLGRDFRFALRALADDIPAAPQLVDELLAQAIDELLYVTGRGRFGPYREDLLERVAALKAVPSGARLAQLLAQRVTIDELEERDTLPVYAHWMVGGGETSRSPSTLHMRFIEIAGRCAPNPDIGRLLCELLVTTDDEAEGEALVHTLAEHGPLPASTSERLIELCATTRSIAGPRMAKVLVANVPLHPAAIDRVIELLLTTDHGGYVAEVAVEHGPFVAKERLMRLLDETGDPFSACCLAEMLSAHGPLPSTATDHLIELLATNVRMYVADELRRLLLAEGPMPPSAVSRMSQMLAATDSANVGASVVTVLAAQGPLAGVVIGRALELLVTTGDRRGAAWLNQRDAKARLTELLIAQGPLPGTAINRLIELLVTADTGEAAASLVEVLAAQGPLPVTAIARVIELLATTEDWFAATSLAKSLAAQSALPELVADRLGKLYLSAGLRAAKEMAPIVVAQGPLPTAAIIRTVELLGRSNGTQDTERLTEALIAQGPLPDIAIKRLIEVLPTDENGCGTEGLVKVLVAQGPLGADAIAWLIEVLSATRDARSAGGLAEVLVAQGPLPAAAADCLIAHVTKDGSYGASYLAKLLATPEALSADATRRLAARLAATDDAESAARLAQVLAGQGSLDTAALHQLVGLLSATHARGLVDVLVAQAPLPPVATDRLVELLATTDAGEVAAGMGQVLAAHGSLPSSAISRVAELVARTDNGLAVGRLENILAAQAPLPAAIMDHLGTAAAEGNKAAYGALWRLTGGPTTDRFGFS